ncbi:hypothetical protein ACH4OY_17135 [Micromonospora rubida]|uniref:Uncharacterized protein n=1 Tax=Micromonospora rubida TaxID=2697657 RepID=A0ABW7SL06_9ACTN
MLPSTEPYPIQPEIAPLLFAVSEKVDGLRAGGINISERVPLLVAPPNEACRAYLRAKKENLGHILPHLD